MVGFVFFLPTVPFRLASLLAMAPHKGYAIVERDDSDVGPLGSTCNDAIPLAEATGDAFDIALEAASSTCSDDTLCASEVSRIGSMLMRVCIPQLLTQLLRVAFNSLTLGFAGHFLSSADLAGIALGLSLCNATCLAVGIGFTVVLDTLSSQEFGRDPRSQLQGLFLRRAVFLVLAYNALLAVLYVFATPLMIAVFGEELGSRASLFMKLALLQGVVVTVFTGLQRFLVAQRHVLLPLYGQIFGVAVMPLFLFVGTRFGLVGFAAALFFGRLMALVFMSTLAWRIESVRHTFGVWSLREVLDRGPCRDFATTCLPVVAASCAERWSFEVLSLLAGMAGPLAMGTYAVTSATLQLLYSVGVGFCFAATTLVGNALGAGKASEAKRVAFVVLGASYVAVVSTAVCYSALRRPFIMMFTSDPAIIDRAMPLTAIMAAVLVFENANCVLQGLLRACGLFALFSKIVLVAQWFVMVPLAWILSSPRLFALEGTLLALYIGGVTQTMASLFFLHRLKWETLVAARPVGASSDVPTVESSPTSIKNATQTGDDEGDQQDHGVDALFDEKVKRNGTVAR